MVEGWKIERERLRQSERYVLWVRRVKSEKVETSMAKREKEGQAKLRLLEMWDWETENEMGDGRHKEDEEKQKSRKDRKENII